MITFEEFTSLVSQWRITIKNISEKYFNLCDTEYKQDNSPVTVADREIEAFLVSEIRRLFPDHSIVGEESGEHFGESTYCWVIDPIDGTRSFIHGVPLFSSLIAFTCDGKPLYGAIYIPISDNLLTGDSNITLHNGVKTMMRNTLDISSATVLSSNIVSINRRFNGTCFAKFIDSCGCFRTWGDGFGYFLLATGKADIMIDPKMMIWDMMALIPVIRGAGGIITNCYGGDVLNGDSVIASVPTLHKCAVDSLK